MLNALASLTAALSSLLTKHKSSKLPLIFFGSKLAINSLSPLLGLLGGLLTLIGLKRNSSLLTALAGFTLWRNLTYILRVTRPHHAFDTLFEEETLPNNGRFLRRRYSLPAPPTPVVTPHQNIPINQEDPDYPLTANLWEPPRSVTRSGLGIVYLHGSSWHYDKYFSQATHYMFAHLAAQGHTILDLQYTKAPRAKVTDMVKEARQGIAWLKTEMKLDNVVLMGNSAGAHIALLSAYEQDWLSEFDGQDVSVRGVIATSPISDLFALHTQLQKYQPIPDQLLELAGPVLRKIRMLPSYAETATEPRDVLKSFLGGTPDEMPETYTQASPITHVGTHCPPTLILHGEGDTATDYQIQSQWLAEKIKMMGGTAVCITYPQTQHAFELFMPRLAPASQAHLYEVERFLAWLQTT